MADSDGPKVTRLGEGEHTWFNGGLITVKVTSEDTHDAYVLVETLGRAGHVTPLRIDPTIETFRVLEGNCSFTLVGVTCGLSRVML